MPGLNRARITEYPHMHKTTLTHPMKFTANPHHFGENSYFCMGTASLLSPRPSSHKRETEKEIKQTIKPQITQANLFPQNKVIKEKRNTNRILNNKTNPNTATKLQDDLNT